MPNLIEIKEFLKNYELKIKDLSKKSHIAHWNAQVTGKKEYYKEAELISKEIQSMHNNKKEFEKVKSFYKQDIKDELIKRQIKMVYDSYLSCQGDIKLIHELTEKELAVDHKFNTLRAKIGNKKLTDNEIKDILRKETDSKKLQQAWEANKEQGKYVEKELLEIVKLRNKLAKSLGFKNYYLLSLELQEQNHKEIKELFERLDKLTSPSFKELKKEIDEELIKKYKVKELNPWHYQDLFFQQGPEIYKVDLDKYYNKDVLKTVEKFYENLNLPVKDIVKRSSWYEAEGKCQHAFAMDIDREGDIRVLENIKNDEYWLGTTLHEIGHAIYWKFMDNKLPFLIRDAAHTLTTEAIAMLFGRLSHNPDFLKANTNITEKELNNLKPVLAKTIRLQQLVFSRWVQVMLNFEKSLYEDPNQNLNKLWWALVKKYQLIDFSRDLPDYASKIHLVTAPVYYHNYMMGELFASQINNKIAEITNQSVKDISYIGKKEIGEFLKNNIFNHGAKYTWDKLIKKATNESLNPKYFAEQFLKNG